MNEEEIKGISKNPSNRHCLKRNDKKILRMLSLMNEDRSLRYEKAKTKRNV